MRLAATPSPPSSPQAERKQINGIRNNSILTPSPNTLLMESGCTDRNICISIPLYVLRSVNFDAHFEYERYYNFIKVKFTY